MTQRISDLDEPVELVVFVFCYIALGIGLPYHISCLIVGKEGCGTVGSGDGGHIIIFIISEYCICSHGICDGNDIASIVVGIAGLGPALVRQGSQIAPTIIAIGRRTA
ncbi:hypothetical protein BMS3Abin08_00383 [bacterium BMS3Abin08]|nr:hypothetical protein BMS3Abin08_00383 [bacterium BMS3Abin08]